MRQATTLLAGISVALLIAVPASGSAAPSGPPVQRTRPPAVSSGAPAFAPRQVLVRLRGEHRARTIHLPRGTGVRAAGAALRRNSAVAYAVPNYIATASGLPMPLPNDPGTLPGEVGLKDGWADRQWNFLPCGSLCGEAPQLFQSIGGIDAVSAWQHLRAAGHAGASGVRIAVLDSGVAYRRGKGGYLRSPDFSARRFAPGYDFVQDDAVPLDQNGHGTHIAGTIGEDTDNGIGVTGLAYNAKLIPVRVLDPLGRGRADEIADGIRFAATHGADVINMSFNFPCGAPVPDVTSAIGFARKAGAVVVASIGNLGAETCVSSPATEPHVIGVGGTTEGACPGYYTLTGEDVDIVAPGGGVSAIPCLPGGRPIIQMTLRPGSRSKFGLPDTYVGTSMAAAHVSGAAAMVIASGVLGPDPPPSQVARRLRVTARDLGTPGRDMTFGAGLLDVGAATDPAITRGAQSGSGSGSGTSSGQDGVPPATAVAPGVPSR